MRASLARRLAVAAAMLLGLAVAYVAAGAWLLRFDLDRLLFPPSPAPAASPGFTTAFRLAGHDGAAMLVRRFDAAPLAPRAGCVVWFPGHGGGLDRYARELFPDLAAAGLVVYAAAYPGQDGAPGPARIDDVQALAAAAVSAVVAACGRTHTVVAGRSLGGMVAVYAADASPPAGVVIESTSPSLSAGIRGALRERWFLHPLALLPVARLVPHDFSLAEAIPPGLHVVIFQGSDDTRTPLADLWPDAGEPSHPPIVVIAGGTHADTLRRAKPAMVAAMLGMIRGSEEAAAAGIEAD